MQTVRGGIEHRTRTRTRVLRRTAVERIEAYMRLHAGDTIPLPELCRIVGLSERSLRNAFYAVRGAGPKRCLLDGRLRDARRALCNAVPGQTTVTSVAIDNGFFDFGRFARAYRELFGEPPSATLRGALSNRPPGSAARTSENANVCRA